MIEALHDYVVLSVALACLYLVVEHRVPTGVLGTAGLAAIIVGLLYSLDDDHNPYIALDVVVGGLGLICLLMTWRLWARWRCPLRRRFDDWDGRGPETVIGPEKRHP